MESGPVNYQTVAKKRPIHVPFILILCMCVGSGVWGCVFMRYLPPSLCSCVNEIPSDINFFEMEENSIGGKSSPFAFEAATTTTLNFKLLIPLSSSLISN